MVWRDLQTLSPMMVLRMWPTCISLAMFGEEKSTITFLAGPTGGGLTPFSSSNASSPSTNFLLRKMFTNPGPATSSLSTIDDGATLATTAVATSLGFDF